MLSNAKRNLITRVLANETYSTDSGLYLSLYRALSRLSESDLGNLALIIEIRETDAAGAMARSLAPRGSFVEGS